MQMGGVDNVSRGARKTTSFKDYKRESTGKDRNEVTLRELKLNNLPNFR